MPKIRRYHYSRLEQIQKKKNWQNTISFSVLTVVLILAIIFFILPNSVKIINLFSRQGNLNSVTDAIPPIQPKLDILPEFTNKKVLEIGGSSEPGSTVKVYVNGFPKEVLSDSNARFFVNADLQDGENKIFAEAMDNAGNESAKSESINVTFDDQPPEIEIKQPTNGASFFGPDNKKLIIKGVVDLHDKVTINDRLVIVSHQGDFTTDFDLNEGENIFRIKVADRAGNTQEKELKVNFSL